jgi:dethiobiotin synthetase
MKPIFITATNTNIGKTYATLKLIDKLSQMGFSVGVFKPIETGVDDVPVDAKLLLERVQRYNPKFKDFTPFDITVYTFKLPSAPFCANSNISITKVINKFDNLNSLCDILLIEGAGGLLVPIRGDYFMVDLAKELNSRLLLVTSSRLGTINDTLLSMEALKQRDIDFEWAINLYQDINSFNSVTKPFFDFKFNKYLSLEQDIEKIIQLLIK